jgi:hypothetical protein
MFYICKHYKTCMFKNCYWNYNKPQTKDQLFFDIKNNRYGSCCDSDISPVRKYIKLILITKFQWLIWQKRRINGQT